MYCICYCIFFCVFTVLPRTLSASFHVEKSGPLPVDKKDVVVQFYLSVANDGVHEITITITDEPKCCWEVAPGDNDCESMILYGEGKLNVLPGKVKNMTYLFPNKYPLNRVGHCVFHLKSGSAAKKHKLHFDTREDLASTWIPGFGYSGKVKKCPSVDQDPYNNCSPVDCAQKYNGKRSFYNVKRQRCERAAWCNTKRDSENLPISAFDKDNNRCKSLIIGSLRHTEKKMMKTESEKTLKLSGMGSMYEAVSNPSKIELDCNYGVQEGAACFCDAGWKSITTTDSDGRRVTEWCNRKISPWGSSIFGYYISVMVVLAVSCSFAAIFLVNLAWTLFVKKFGYSSLSSIEALVTEEDSEDESDSDEIDNSR